MIHPNTELRHVSDAIGVGVFATRDIARGTIVWLMDELDQKFSVERVRELGPRYEALLDRYAYQGPDGERILCWDLARFVNHSCEANAVSTGWDLDIAVRNIAAGEELTNDYGALNLERSFVCRCGAPSCRRVVRPDDFERLADVWDGRVASAYPELLSVVQPLWQWVPNKRRVTAAARDPRRVPSIRKHRLVPITATRPSRLARVASAAG
jgi:uncharacterized protein